MATNQLIVSYSREDNEHPVDAVGDGWGKAFVKGLERRHDRDLGHQRGVFFDGESIEEATDWRSRLDKRIRHLRLFFVFLSPTSVTPMKCPFDWGESHRCEHYAAHGDDGLKPIDLVAPDDLRRAESETIADWLQAMERDYPSFTVRGPRATPGAQRVGKRVAAALARHNVTSNLPFNPLSGKGSDVLRERIRHQPECYCPEDDPPELKRADFLELPETNGLAWTDDRASRTAYDWEHRHNTLEDKPDCRRQTRVGTLIGWSMQRLSTEARRALELASLFVPDEIPNERVRHLTPNVTQTSTTPPSTTTMTGPAPGGNCGACECGVRSGRRTRMTAASSRCQAGVGYIPAQSRTPHTVHLRQSPVRPRRECRVDGAFQSLSVKPQ